MIMASRPAAAGQAIMSGGLGFRVEDIAIYPNTFLYNMYKAVAPRFCSVVNGSFPKYGYPNIDPNIP